MAIPVELTRLHAWAVSTGDVLPDGKLDKIPRNPLTGAPIDPTNANHWADYDTCAEAVASGKFKLLGMLLSGLDPYVVIDLDPHTPDDEATAEKISQAFSDTYQEISAGGRGIHIICRGELPVDGCRRGGVELYANRRYMICTGNTFLDNEIVEKQQLLTQLWVEVTSGATSHRGGPDLGNFDPDADDTDCRRSDAEILEIASTAENAAKFNALCAGQWAELGYPSQSEADLALFNMLAFYSDDNSQCVRIFRMTALGRREKASRDDYMRYCMATARAAIAPSVLSTIPSPLDAAAPAPVDTAPLEVSATPVPETSGPAPDADVDEWGYAADYVPMPWPPGWAGQLAYHIYRTSLRPVPEVGIMAALAIIAGFCGRSYNTATGAGLNLYQILVAPTGVGKEGLKSGIDRVTGAIRPAIPVIDDRTGPAVIASGQALIKLLDKKPCCLSIFGEFGQTIARLSDARCSGSDRMLLQMLLDIYTKSGHGSRLDGMVYSDRTKDVPVVDAPCFSFIGETTPQIYADLDLSMVESGLLPRINLVEYTGNRPKMNYDIDVPMDDTMLRQLTGMVLTGFALEQRKSVVNVKHSPEAEDALRAINDEADDRINANRSEAVRQLWNRYHLKILKISSLLAVIDDFNAPRVTLDHVRWAELYCRRDIDTWVGKFSAGEIGSTDIRAEGILTAALRAYAHVPVSTRVAAYRVPAGAAHMDDIVPMRYIRKRLKRHSFFQKHTKGTASAIDAAIKEALAAETLVELPIADKIALGIAQTARMFKILDK